MIKITCPFCGFTRNVEKEKIPKKAKSIICPICNKKFGFLPDFYLKAGFWQRFLAMLIDILIIKIVAIILGYVTDELLTYVLEITKVVSQENVNLIVGGVIYFIFVLLPFFYFTISTCKYGKTIGKQFIGIKVIDRNGKVPDLSTSIKREVFGKTLSGLLLGIGYLIVLFDKEKQALHDKIANTYVVYIEL
jgi:uncharacterized RDD family membrane protein YckC